MTLCIISWFSSKMYPFHSDKYLDLSKQVKVLMEWTTLMMAAVQLGEPVPGLWYCACSVISMAHWWSHHYVVFRSKAKQPCVTCLSLFAGSLMFTCASNASCTSAREQWYGRMCSPDTHQRLQFSRSPFSSLVSREVQFPSSQQSTLQYINSRQ